MGIKQRREIADYLMIPGTGSTGAYALMGVGVKTLNESPSAQTKSRRYVCDKSASKSISSYDSSFPYELDQIREQEAIDYICKIGEEQLVGADAETDYVRVDLSKKVASTAGEYEARKFRVAVEVATFDNDDGELNCSGNLLQIGDVVKGKFNVSTKTFTEEGEA